MTKKKTQPTLSTPKFAVKKRKPGTTARQQLHMYGSTVTQQAGKDACDIRGK